MATKKRTGQSLLTASSRIEESMLCRRFTGESGVTISQKLIKKLRQWIEVVLLSFPRMGSSRFEVSEELKENKSPTLFFNKTSCSETRAQRMRWCFFFLLKMFLKPFWITEPEC
ncbi:hypothetical protein I7I48_05631 [Histoplasma ohiense]|nr:hypothetical protein I7I48_05631 [Histoplasma ohiense (nom. inval.)]